MFILCAQDKQLIKPEQQQVFVDELKQLLEK